MYSTEYSSNELNGFTVILLLFIIFFSIISYVFQSIACYRLAVKAKHENPWFAWVPILNSVQLWQLSKTNIAWMVCMFIPYVSTIAAIYIGIKYMMAFGRTGAQIILYFIPIVNIIYLWIMSTSDDVEYLL